MSINKTPLHDDATDDLLRDCQFSIDRGDKFSPAQVHGLWEILNRCLGLLNQSPVERGMNAGAIRPSIHPEAALHYQKAYMYLAPDSHGYNWEMTK